MLGSYSEFREPFVGGGSVFIYLKQFINKISIYSINDINYTLYCFWESAKNQNESLVKEIYNIKKHWSDGAELFKYLTNYKSLNILDVAVRYFILNRITFSGVVDSGGYSKSAFLSRFTTSSIERVRELKNILKNVNITQNDYTELLFKSGRDVFIFLDPPYLSATKSRLYGENGVLHKSFNHKEFSENVKKCKHNFLITIDDCEEIRNYFSFANIHEVEFQYGMNNYKQIKSAKGRELIITNYKLSNTLFVY